MPADLITHCLTIGRRPDLLRQTLLPICARQGKPLLAGWPSGHGTPNRPLPMGLRVALDADAGTLTLQDDLLQAK